MAVRLGKPTKQKGYQQYLKSFRWTRIIRPVRRLLDRGHCRTCHAQSRLQVHHASYKHRGSWQWIIVGPMLEIWDTITLCNKCHSGVHSKESLQIKEKS